MRKLLLPALLACLFAGGCARYEYDVTHPPEHATHIGRKIDSVLRLEPIEYRLRTVDNRLVVRIFNPTDQPIELLGDKSVLVDPTGQSRPILSQSIAPHSFLKLTLPPLRPRVYDPGPHFGIGFGTSFGHVHRRHHAYHGHPVRYFCVVDDDGRYWDWEGQTNVRMTLAYLHAQKQFVHELAFHRKKM